MALNNLTGQNIQDTYQKVVQTDGTNLADGTGSLLPISFNGNDVIISGSLTAHQYIVSSSVTNITIATLSGSTTFGNSTDDTHTFTGNITASGNISASGTITATSFTGSLQGTASFAISSSFVNTAQTASFVTTAQTASFVNTAQTASFVTLAQTASFVNTAQTASFVTTAQTASFVNTAQTASFVTTAQTASYVKNAQTASYVENAQTASFVNTLNQSVTITGAITASANISASGFLTAQNITASGNISTSGYLVAQNITASGNISASGTITATSFTGSLKGTASTASIATTVTLTATNATNATHYLTFTDAAIGNENVRTDTSLTYNPFSNTLSATTVLASLVNASRYQYNNPDILTAAGSNQATATPIIRSGPIFVTGVSGGGIILPSWSETVYILTIHNMSLTDSFLLYPFALDRIGTLGSNAPATVPAGGSIILTSGGPALKIWQGYLGNNTDGTITATSINGTINGGTF
jgi:hypothetical protein